MLVKKFATAWGVSGDEGEIRRIIADTVRPFVDNIEYDALGSIIAAKKGKRPGPKVMICAHMDEVGLLITGINEDGTLSFECSGGIDARVLGSKPVYIGENRVPGVVRSVAGCFKSYIDIGAACAEEAEKAVEVGDYAIFATEFTDFGSGLIKSRALDDRIGCAVLAEILKKDYDIPVYGVFSAQEEIGERGAYAASCRVGPDIGIVLEGTVCADMANVEGYRQSTTLGGGPAISIADRTTYFDIELSNLLCEIAKLNNIRFQRRRITGGGNDGGAIHLAGTGARCVTVSVPCRYIHSPVSVASPRDYEETVRLISLFLEYIQHGGKI
ncbi:MAG: M42 family peptidase [Firmicutes bacterium]|nr:M42 family peptidase [Bacillota bacterium]